MARKSKTTRVLAAAAATATALAALAGGVGAASCTSSSTQATVVPPTGTQCIVLYTASWNYLAQQSTSGSATVAVGGLKSAAGNIEFYTDSGCSPSAYSSAIACTAAATGGSSGGSGGATSAPTTKPTATTNPTAKPTTTAKPTATTIPTAKPTAATTTTAPPTKAPTSKPGSTMVPATNGYNGGPPAGQLRAIYLWGMGDCMLNQVAASAYPSKCSGAANYLAYQDQVLGSLTDPFGRYAPFNRIYFDVDPNLLTSAAATTRAFLAKASAQGIAVELLAGDSSWVSTPAAVATPVGICQQLAAFNKGSASAAQRFAGIHLDVEPYTAAGWTTNSGAGTDPYNDATEANVLSMLRQCKTAFAGSGLTVAWDIPTWFSKLATDIFTPLVASPATYIDYVSIMNYYGTQANWINGVGGVGGIPNNLGLLGNGKVPAVFAVETQDTSVVPSSQSFWSQGALYLENCMGTAGFQFAATPGFLGTAVHHYGSYFIMKQ